MQGSQQGNPEVRDGEPVHPPPVAEWDALFSATSDGQFHAAWLRILTTQISGLQGALLAVDQGGAFRPAASWPEEQPASKGLAEIAERVIEEQTGLVSRVEGAAMGRYALGYPVQAGGRLVAVVALEVIASGEAALRESMGRLRWGAAWLENHAHRLRHTEDSATLARLGTATDLLAGVLAEGTFQEAATRFVTELSLQLNCDRVSIGFSRRRRMQVVALSNSAQFGKKMDLIRAIAAAMDEVAFQRKEILIPAPEEGPVLLNRDHIKLATHHHSPCILSLPLADSGEAFGALVLERADAVPFTEQELSFCRSIAALAGPVLRAMRSNDRPLPMKIADSAGRQIVRLFGGGYVFRKAALLLLIAVVAFFSVATGDYRVHGNAQLESDLQRVVAAPFDGYIDTAPIRAGDLVTTGELLATINDKDLRIERLKWISERAQLRQQVQEAVAGKERSKVAVLNAQIEQANAELELVESRLARTTVTAPFDGLVVSGDLSQMVGGAVQQGDVLFEIAPLERYRLIVKVDERQIGSVAVGQEVTLVLASLPEQRFTALVTKLTPVSTAEDDINYFRVEALLDSAVGELRPGMQGVAKIVVEERKLIWIWTRSMVDWLRLQLWSLWP